MSNGSRILLALVVLGLPLALGGCPGDYSGGYAKVPYREPGPLVMIAAPDPPPLAAGAAGAAAVEAPVLPADAAPPGVTQAMVDEGLQLYGTICTACHGPGGAGTPAGPALNDPEWLNIGGGYEEIVTTIQSGVASPLEYPAPMPPLGGGNFTPEQVRALGAYVYALGLQPGA